MIHRFAEPSTSQFLVSTRPQVAPLLIVQRIKCRLQAPLRPDFPKAFQRNYALRSIGSADRKTIDAYVASQLEHHPMADEKVMAEFREYQFVDRFVDLSQPARTSHAIYWCNLHLVVVNAARYRDINRDRITRRNRII